MNFLKNFTALAALALLLGLTTNANALSITPCGTYAGPNADPADPADPADQTFDCKHITVSGASNPTEEINLIEAAFGLSTESGLNLLYKSDFADALSGVEDPNNNAAFDPFYSTTYSATTDPTGATISYTGGATDPQISCPDCYLFVKDGAGTPNAYAFNLGTLADIAVWDNHDTNPLVLTGFWAGVTGAISHVALYGTSVVPVPAAVWLFGTALLGFIGFSRRTQV